jgi:uncharacterized protein (DUF302 family)
MNLRLHALLAATALAMIRLAGAEELGARPFQMVPGTMQSYPGMMQAYPGMAQSYPSVLPPIYMLPGPMQWPLLPAGMLLPYAGQLMLPMQLPQPGMPYLPQGTAAPPYPGQMPMPDNTMQAPFTGIMLPPLGDMTQLPPLVPDAVQSIDPPSAPGTATPAAPAQAPAQNPAPEATAEAKPLAAAKSAPEAVVAAPSGPAMEPPRPPAAAPVTASQAAPAAALPAPAPVAMPLPTAPAPMLMPTPGAFPFNPFLTFPTETTGAQATPAAPYTVRRAVGQQEKQQLIQFAVPMVTGMMRLSLAEAINYFAQKYKAKAGIGFDDVVLAMKRRAGKLNLSLVGDLALLKNGKTPTSDPAQPRIEIFGFSDSAIERELLKISPEFVIFLPSRIAVMEDNRKEIWVMMLDWNPEWVMGYKDKLAIADELWQGAVDLRQRMDNVMQAAANGEP